MGPSRRLRPSVAAVAAASALSVLVLAGCSGGSSKPAASGSPATTSASSPTSSTPTPIPTPAVADLMQRVKTDTTGATSVHVKGSGTNSGTNFKLDLSLASDGRAAGTIDGGTGALTILRAGGKDYVQITDAYIAQQKIPTAQANLVRGKYFLLSGSDAASLDQLMNMKTLMAQANDNSITYTINGTADVNGQTAFVLDGNDGSVLYVAAQGKALPLRVTGTPTDPGQMDFTGWNTNLAIPAAPPADQIVDLSQLSTSATT